MQIILNLTFWLGIMALVDGSLGLLFLEKWQKMVKQWNVQKVALIEIAIAWCLLAAHYLLVYFVL
ncbi:hypothetical protein P4B35_19360 [Pontiellaceae bacterium B12227]|nr:hypothetical protein [Pontiellaceae bacterium B12227]